MTDAVPLEDTQNHEPLNRLVNRIPASTYRLQLGQDFGFKAIRDLIPYIDALGISDLYLSPIFVSRLQSSHGYDVVDHNRFEPSIGGVSDFGELALAARHQNMGIMIDLVPNHMGINDPGNLLWNDVLANGAAARSANCFDIDWNPPNGSLQGQVLLPFLGKPFGEALESGEINLLYERGCFFISYFDRRFPVSPPTWPDMVDLALTWLEPEEGSLDRRELQSIATQLRRLPKPEDRSETATEERYREQDVASDRLRTLVDRSHEVRNAIEKAVREFNGVVGDNRSFDRLETLISLQNYRLAYWRVASDEINYRRFFDINDLAALRVENEDVFDRVHEMVFGLLASGQVTGLRIDHPDGLLDPREYFENLQNHYRRCMQSQGSKRDAEEHGLTDAGSTPERAADERFPPLYLVVEKILAGDERLREDWPISGTTGYEFLNQVTALLVDGAGLEKIRAIYPALSGMAEQPRDVIYRGKLAILHDSMSSELALISSQLFRIAKANRSSQDFTLPALHRALREVIACFSVYRTYIQRTGWELSDEDHRRVMEAVRWAKRRNRTMNWRILDYIASVLLLEFPPSLGDESRQKWRQFATRFQQVTGPIAAKGVEDTAFYRYFPLLAMNEVGGELEGAGLSVEQFTLKMQERARSWPHSLSATATHDTKRGEDVRARLDVVSEVPEQWAALVESLNVLTDGSLTEVDGELAPSLNERYFIYQTLVGTWPGNPDVEDQWKDYHDRLRHYFQKAMREAKQHTSWLNPSDAYEAAIEEFVSAVLEPKQNEAFRLIDSFVEAIKGAGFVNSISQLALKSMLPGVPDFYQGCEFWDFRLVDPDNRQPVDFARRTDALQELIERFDASRDVLLDELVASWDDRLKLFVTWRALQTRRKYRDLFADGDYEPADIAGPLSHYLLGFYRRSGSQWLFVVVPRHPQRLLEAVELTVEQSRSPRSFTGSIWGDCQLILPSGAPTQWVDELSGNELTAVDGKLPVDQVLSKSITAFLFAS